MLKLLYCAYSEMYLLSMLDNIPPVTGLSSCVCVASSPSEGNAVMKALQEANMSTEVGLVVLDILALYTQTFKVSPTA